MREHLLIQPGHAGMVVPCHDSASMDKPHSHEECEFNLVVGGSAHYVINGSRYLMVPGTIVWLFPEQEHLVVDYSPDFSMWVVVFSREIARETRMIERYAPEGDPLFCRRLAQADSDSLLALCMATADPAVGVCAFNHGLWFLVDTARRYSHNGDQELPVQDLSALVTSAIRALGEASGNLSLEEAARSLNVSASWLGRSFVRETGVSFVRYRNRLKLAEFLRLRRERPCTTLTELALSAGFGSYVQFVRVYSRVYGHAPSRTT